MKKLITIGICALGLAGFSATDAKIKEMLAKKDYMSAVVEVSALQLTNGVVTAADVNGLVDAAVKTNAAIKTRILCNANMYAFADAIAAYEAVKNPKGMLYIAEYSKNNDLMVETWAKALDMPETTGEMLFKHCPTMAIREANLELFKRSAEKILKEYPHGYCIYVFNHNAKTSEYIEWSKTCIKNINSKTIGNGWFSILNYDRKFTKLNFLRTDEYYFEDVFKKYAKELNGKQMYKFLTTIKKASYFDKAIELIEKNITKPDAAFEFSKYVNKKEKNKKVTERVFPVISKDVKLGLDAALYLNDTDKIIDMLLVANEELTAEQLEKVIPVINSLSADYRAADVVKALRNINARYTLRLYNERETWEPILSKIRALIDVRQN
jgi:hypothetical protein